MLRPYTNPASGVVMRWTILLGVLFVPQAPPPRLTGDWQARTGGGDEIRHVMVRPDSSAQFGRDLARWRVVGDSLWITLGDGVWQVYGMKDRRRQNSRSVVVIWRSRSRSAGWVRRPRGRIR